MLKDDDNRFVEVARHRGFRILSASTECPTSWKLEIRIGEGEGEGFIETLPRAFEEFSKADGLVNCAMTMVEEAKAAIDQRCDDV